MGNKTNRTHPVEEEQVRKESGKKENGVKRKQGSGQLLTTVLFSTGVQPTTKQFCDFYLSKN